MKKALIISFFFAITLAAYDQAPELVMPVGHTSSFGKIYFSPDGTKVATTAFKSKMVAVWDVRSGKLLATFNDTLAFWGFEKIQFSPDGSKLLTQGGGTMLWDIEKKIFLGYLHQQTEEANTEDSAKEIVTFSPDGKFIVIASDSLINFSLPGTSKKVQLLNAQSFVESMLFSKQGKYLLCQTNTTSQLWNVKTGHLQRKLEKGVYTFSSDGEKLIELRTNGITVMDCENGKIINRLEQSLSGIILISPAVTHFLSLQKSGTAVNNYTVRLLSLENGQLLNEWKNIASAWFYPDNKNIIITKKGTQSTVTYETWSVATLKRTASWQDKLFGILSEKGDRLASVADNMIRVFNVKTGNLLQQWNWQGHIPAYKMLLAGSGNKLVTLGSYLSLWDIDKGELKQSFFIGDDKYEYENTGEVFFSPDEKFVIIIKNGNWKLIDAITGLLLLKSEAAFKGKVLAAFSHDGHQLLITFQNLQGGGYALLIDPVLRKTIKRISLTGIGLSYIAFSPDDKKLILSYVEKNKTEIRQVLTFAPLKTLTGIHNGSSRDGKRMVTINRDKSTSYVWDVEKGIELKRQNGVASISPDGSKIVSNYGMIVPVTEPGTSMMLEGIDDTYRLNDDETPGLELTYPYFSNDGNKIIAGMVNSGSAGYFPAVDVWDGATGRRLKKTDLESSNNEFVSSSGEKILLVPVNGDEDLQIIDTDSGELINLAKSKEAVRSDNGVFSNDDQYLFTINGGAMKKWEVATGRLLFTFFPIDSSSYLTQIPTGYYSCNPDASRILHYVNGLQVISFSQLDIRFNRPDKVLEYIRYPDSTLINAYHKAWLKRIKKAGLDTSYFQNKYSVPQADFVNREETDNEQTGEKIIVRISASDSSSPLDRFNIWINEVPLFGMKGISLLPRNTRQFDTVVTLSLAKGDNSIETSVTNIYGVESYRSPLLVKYLPPATVLIPETIHFIGIGINRFANKDYNLTWSVKDITDMASALQKKYSTRFQVDTLFNEQVNIANIKALRQKLLQTGINDRIVIAYSGHGLLSKDYDYYLSTYNVNFEKPELNGLPYEELENLLDSIPARKKLMLIDACHSGEVDKEEGVAINRMADSLGLAKGIILEKAQQQQVGLKNSFELMQSLFVNVGKSTGATIISAAAGNQFALERGDLKNGVFTYCILEAMKKHVSMKISNLKKIVGERVVQLTNGLQKPTSRNENIAVDWNLW